MNTETSIPFRIKSSLHGNEFDGEGREEVVKEQYTAWLKAATNAPREKNDEGNKSPKSGNNKEHEPLNRMWDRAYMRTDDCVSLHVIPKTETFNADSLLLLLYGFQTLNKRDTVSAGELLSAAKQSGLRIDRIDHWLRGQHGQYVIKGGNRRGSRYSLNNPGRTRAQELLEELFD
jgi:hypothetical protein